MFRDEVIDNTRYKKMVFQRPQDAPSCVLHGFAGYFDSKLYGAPRLHICAPVQPHSPHFVSPIHPKPYFGLNKKPKCICIDFRTVNIV
eukprot:scaffold461340_cov30-Prasinocladus_malaysianus.AAC.1